MSLKDLKLEPVYDTNMHNILEEFYIPVLSESIIYNRVAGYFSSNALAIAAEGIKKFILNGGKMQLVACVQLTEGDQNAIKEVLEEKEKEIIKEIETMSDALKKGHICFLAWMMKHNKLEIKIANVRGAIAHKKVGIFEDKEGNKISFNGSDNESAGGWLHNDESFHDYSSGNLGEKKHLEGDIKIFEDLWNQKPGLKAQVYCVSEAFKKGLIRNAPKDDKEFMELSEEVADELIKKNREILEKNKLKKIRESILQIEKEEGISNIRVPWPHQIDSIKKWEENGRKGILSIATGCGKTDIGISKLKENILKGGINLIISPKNEINAQWEKDLKSIPDITIITNKKTNWKIKSGDALKHLEKKRIKNVIFIVTYDSLYNLINIMRPYALYSENNLLIADEVHTFGAEKTSKIMEDEFFKNMFKQRLGLSATPESIFDSERNNKLYEFMGPIVYKFRLIDGIKARILCKYNYYLNIVEMTSEDFKEYNRLSTEISGKYWRLKDHEERLKSLDTLYFERAKIVKKSKSKYAEFDKIIKKLKSQKDINYTFVFAEDHNHLREVSRILDNNSISYSEIVENTSSLDRKKIFQHFIENRLEVINSTSILDEGINIKELKNAIILSSSTNPRQYVQRRGRVLRNPDKDPNKIASIYDFMVIPPQINDETFDVESKIIDKEFKRAMEFIKYSENRIETLYENIKLIKLIKTYRLREVEK